MNLYSGNKINLLGVGNYGCSTGVSGNYLATILRNCGGSIFNCMGMSGYGNYFTAGTGCCSGNNKTAILLSLLGTLGTFIGGIAMNAIQTRRAEKAQQEAEFKAVQHSIRDDLARLSDLGGTGKNYLNKTDDQLSYVDISEIDGLEISPEYNSDALKEAKADLDKTTKDLDKLIKTDIPDIKKRISEAQAKVGDSTEGLNALRNQLKEENAKESPDSSTVSKLEAKISELEKLEASYGPNGGLTKELKTANDSKQRLEADKKEQEAKVKEIEKEQKAFSIAQANVKEYIEKLAKKREIEEKKYTKPGFGVNKNPQGSTTGSNTSTTEE